MNTEQRLSPRQVQVAELVARGLDRKEIATALGVTPQTAAEHIKQAAAKLPGDKRPRVKLSLWFFRFEQKTDIP